VWLAFLLTTVSVFDVFYFSRLDLGIITPNFFKTTEIFKFWVSGSLYGVVKRFVLMSRSNMLPRFVGSEFVSDGCWSIWDFLLYSRQISFFQRLQHPLEPNWIYLREEAERPSETPRQICYKTWCDNALLHHLRNTSREYRTLEYYSEDFAELLLVLLRFGLLWKVF
jgi:hypothetical protein